MIVESYQIGKKITIIRKDDAEKNEYASYIQNIKPGVIYINIPYREENPLILRHNEIIQVSYIADDAMFSFPTTYIGEHKESTTLRLYKIKEPEKAKIKRIQLRKFVRVAVMVEISYLLPEEKAPVRALTVDISAGGMRLAVGEPIALNTVINLCLNLPHRKGEMAVELKGKVLRCILVDQERKIYHVGIQFLNVSRNLEDAICSFVFEKQMEQMRKR